HPGGGGLARGVAYRRARRSLFRLPGRPGGKEAAVRPLNPGQSPALVHRPPGGGTHGVAEGVCRLHGAVGKAPQGGDGGDALVGRGLADPARLGLYGWSNGAILTNLLVTRTTRYRAAVVGAGTTEYVSDWSSCEFGEAFDRYYLGKSPLEDPALYLRKSPF